MFTIFTLFTNFEHTHFIEQTPPYVLLEKTFIESNFLYKTI